MATRPISTTVIGWLFIAVGAVALIYHLSDLTNGRPFEHRLVWICFVRLLAIVGGVFLLRGCNWARWLLLLWLAFHVVRSAFHSPVEVAVHGLLAGVIGFLLFRPVASAYFRGEIAGTSAPEKKER